MSLLVYFLPSLFGKIPRMPPHALSNRFPLSSLLLIFALFLVSCSSSSSQAYPTYNPFVPVNGSGITPTPLQGGGSVMAATTHAGPTPTRAPISVTVPPRNSNAGFTTPTPDPPHPLPPIREYVDQYVVQAGDTLGDIAQRYGVSLEALMQANGLNESSILSVGVVLNIPPINADPNPGSSFKIIPDSELVYGPASVGFDLDAFVQKHGGYLAGYVQEVDGEYLSGSQILTRIAQNYSVNPRLLLALLEYRSGWVTNPVPSNIEYPFGNFDVYYAGLYRQAAWAANNLNRGYYLWRANAISTLPLSDGTYVPLDPTINAGTAGVQYFLSLYNDRASWDLDVSNLGLFRTYNLLFGYPFDYDIASLLPPGLTQPPMQLPFEPGVTWSFTGGPHGGWDSGSAWAALDFAPPGEGGGCAPSPAWIVAVADGWIVRAGHGAVVQDLDNDGYEQTGWTILYMHVDSYERVQPNTYVYSGERIGHPSCEGGVSNATHLHIARRYNGEWIPADGNLPFNLDGWISSGAGVEYDGYLRRGETVIEAWEGVFEGLNQISR
ncbi:MAG TPA: LysM peptidoglycan-binding domain-containing M23 family metallopeptidase [Anaerolineales bacterium]|nr:LysM peptidoglycan-binding domain-containing M23 family metallopeptidase [Anaerolineales bacterium]